MRHATDIINVATFVISKNIYRLKIRKFIEEVKNLMKRIRSFEGR